MTDATDRPLDALIPGLRPSVDTGGLGFIDATVGSDRVWVLGLSGETGGLRAIHQHAGQIIEAALLRALAQPAASLPGEPPTALHLLELDPQPADLEPALAAYGLGPSQLSGPRWVEISSALAKKSGHHHLRSYTARVRPPAPEVLSLHSALLDRTVEVWGESPGAPARRLLALLGTEQGSELAPTLAALDLVEERVSSRAIGVIRWVPPLILQAVADLVGLLAHEVFHQSPAWSVAEAEEDGFVPPPVLRIGEGPEEYHVPVLLHLIRWWVLPIQEGEEVPPLSAWMAEQFGD